MGKIVSSTVKFLCDGSPIFKRDGEAFKAKPGFNEMPEKFTSDPYYTLCLKGGIIKDFVSAPTDKQMEKFDAQIKAEREKREAAEKELEELKAKIAESGK